MATLIVFLCAVTADGLLMLAPAGHLLTWIEVLVLALIAILAVVAVALAPGAWMWVVPVVALVVFLVPVAPVIGVPDDAVLRDAQGGIAIAVVLGGQFALVTIGMMVGASRAHRGQRPVPADQEGEYPERAAAGAPGRSGKAIGALVCGIGSLVILGIIVGIVAIVLGVMARKEIAAHPEKAGSGMALAGIVLGAMGFVLGIVILAPIGG
ncbi:MAG: DUF4190 domain-containing protein [Actinobacteria bacterium]|nr:DUF4190 domain-containing protein [Actinomycetota bacterium]